MNELFDGKCPACNGDGEEDTAYYENRSVCDTCEGTGLKMTEKGRHAVVLMWRTVSAVRLSEEIDRSRQERD